MVPTPAIVISMLRFDAVPIKVISLPDLAAMKLNAIANRGSKKDFYDVAEL